MTITSAEPEVVLSMPVERLEAGIVELSSQIAGATSDLLCLVGEFDAVEGWRSWGMSGTGDWLSWKCGVSRHTAAEQVRVARKMREFPALVEPFRAGRLSYSKVRSISRIMTEATVETLIRWAQQTSAANIDRIVAGQRRVKKLQDVQAQQANRHLTYRTDDDGSIVGTFRLPPEQAAVVLRAMDAALAVLPDPDPEIQDTTEAAVEPDDGCDAIEREYQASRRPVKSKADALVLLADAAWAHLKDEAQRSGDSSGLPGLGASRFDLVIHVPAGTPPADDADDVDADGYQIEGGSRLHPSTGRRLTCDCSYAIQTDHAQGNPLHLGRKTRRIRGRLARAVHRRDGGHCQAPGCNRRTTTIHHWIHWADGGSTCIDNLISLCDSHHWLVHEGGWTIQIPARGIFAFHRPDGTLVPATNAIPRVAPDLPYDPAIAADAITGYWSEGPLPLDNCIAGLFNEETYAAIRRAAAMEAVG